MPRSSSWRPRSRIEAGPPPLQSLGQPSAIHVALLALAEWPLPPEALAGASPPILAAVARAPALAGAERLPATEQAFLVGAASADQVAARYAELADVDRYRRDVADSKQLGRQRPRHGV